jgi:hypothetical protein
MFLKIFKYSFKKNSNNEYLKKKIRINIRILPTLCATIRTIACNFSNDSGFFRHLRCWELTLKAMYSHVFGRSFGGREYNFKPMNYTKCVLFRKVLMVNIFYSKATSMATWIPNCPIPAQIKFFK